MTKHLQTFLGAALVASVCQGVAFAQSAETPPDAPLKIKPIKPFKPIKNPAEAAEAEKVLEGYAECVAKAGSLRKYVAAYLAIPAGQSPPAELANKVSPSQCLGPGGRMMMNTDTFRGALFTAPYRREFGKVAPTEFAPATAYESEFEQRYHPLSDKQVALRFVGDCASAQNLTAAHRFVIARVRSEEETSLLPEIVEALSHCIRQGEQVELRRPALKGMLAESLYKFRHGTTQTRVASAQ